jgi:hypothetical protein
MKSQVTDPDALESGDLKIRYDTSDSCDVLDGISCIQSVTVIYRRLGKQRSITLRNDFTATVMRENSQVTVSEVSVVP